MKPDEEIRVRVLISDYPKELPMLPPLWEHWIDKKLRDAGVPMDRGTITRLDDPADFGESIYVWRPDKEAQNDRKPIQILRQVQSSYCVMPDPRAPRSDKAVH